MAIEFDSIEDKLVKPEDYLPDYDHEEGLLAAKHALHDLDEYVEKLRADIILAQDWQKQITNWIINAEKPVEDGYTPRSS